MDVLRRLALPATLAVLLVVIGCGALRSVSYDAHREQDEHELLATGPDALRDLLGEPDEWSQEEVKDQLQITATWYCADGEYRQVVWRSRIRDRGRQYWTVVSDLTDECRTPGGS